ncbi:hypothetical protein ABIC27_002341 [Streptomyces sp. PvR034]
MHHWTKGTRTNPLRRDADRARTRTHAVFALTCLLAVIAGVALGRAAWKDGHRAHRDRPRSGGNPQR